MPYTRPYPSGFEDYPNTSTPLTASVLNTMEQGIAEASSIYQIASTAPLNPQTGSQWYDTSTNILKTWTGGRWDPISTPYRVLNTYFAGTAADRQDIASNAWVAINNLSITLTPESTSSKFLLMAYIAHSATHVSSFTFFRGGSNLFSHANTNETGALVTLYWGQSDPNSFMLPTTFSWVDSPNTTSSLTYDVRGTASWANVVYTMRINDRSTDMRSRSSFTIMEIRA